MRIHYPIAAGLALAAASVTLAAAQTPRPPAISQDQLTGRLAATLDSLAALDQFSGVVVLGKNGAPVFQRALGMADREAARPNDPETAFNLGSINKAFTQIAIRQLAQAGKLDLDSTLARYWPDYPNADVARRVTVRQLLQHRSGIGGNIFGAPAGAAGGSRTSLRRLSDLLPLFAAVPLQFEPGTRQQYSNAGYVVLGLLVERRA